MHPAGDAVGTDEAVRDLCVLAPAERLVERVVVATVIRVHGRVPVDHVRVGLGAAEQTVSAGALKQLLERAVRQGKCEIDVRPDDVEKAGEAVARLSEAGCGLLADGDVGDDPFDEHAAVGLRARAGAIPQRARDPVEADEPIGHLGIVATQQAVVERLVLGPVRRGDPRLPERPLLDAVGKGPADQASMAPGDSWWT